MKGGFMSKKMLKSMKTEEVVICVLLVVLVVLVVYYIYQNNSSEGFEAHSNKKDEPETVVYFFYVDWCGYCKQAKPEIKKLEEKIKNNEMNNVSLVKVNCDEEEDKAKEFGIRGYPTIVAEKNGEKNTFNSRVNADDIQKWVRTL